MGTDELNESVTTSAYALLDGVADAVLISEGASIVHANDAARALLGGQQPLPEDLVALSDRVLGEDRPLFEGLLRRDGSPERQAAPTELRLLDAYARQFWVAISVRPVLDDSGRWLRIWTLSNISERKRAQECLRDGLNSLAWLVSNLQGMAYRCSNTRHWHMHFVSDGCFELTGYSSSDLLYSRTVAFADLVPKEDLEVALVQIHEAVSAGQPFELVYRLITATGVEKLVLDRGTGAGSQEGGEPTELQGFIADITGLPQRLRPYVDG